MAKWLEILDLNYQEGQTGKNGIRNTVDLNQRTGIWIVILEL